MSKYFNSEIFNSWYIVVLDRNGSELSDDERSWCKENLDKDEWVWNIFTEKIVFAIKNPNDVMMFKLTWV